LVLVRHSMNTPPQVFAAQLQNDSESIAQKPTPSITSAYKIETFNDALLAQFTFGKTEELYYKGYSDAKGKAQHDAHLWIIYPPGFDAKKKYPLMHSIHGGPHTASSDGWHFRWNNHAFAAQGYIVVCVNYHGSSSFGFEFQDSITYEWGKRELADIEAATDLLIKRPYVDAKRLFATGGSYGGYMVAWMNAHVKKGRYQAYICHAGCFDWVSMFADDAYYWHAKELGGYYWDKPEVIEAQNPRSFAKSMETPTLVIHGLLDYRVPDGQGLQYYNTLKAKGVDARLVFFPDENHWILKPQNSRLWYGEFFAWLKRYDTAGSAKKAPVTVKKPPK
jgi:dipeptidyl aminopeptidase/acylaminoacyl peptidase